MYTVILILNLFSVGITPRPDSDMRLLRKARFVDSYSLHTGHCFAVESLSLTKSCRVPEISSRIVPVCIRHPILVLEPTTKNSRLNSEIRLAARPDGFLPMLGTFWVYLAKSFDSIDCELKLQLAEVDVDDFASRTALRQTMQSAFPPPGALHDVRKATVATRKSTVKNVILPIVLLLSTRFDSKKD